MEIKWLGHASFLIISSQGTRIVTDPFDDSVGYKIPNVEADIVTVSHEHFDHNAVSTVKGKPRVVKEGKALKIKDVTIEAFSTFHDMTRGRQRGSNTIFIMELDGMRLCHLGDLGHELEEDQVKKLGRVDILFIPVGGYYTIDANQADRIISKIKPPIVIPMHYKTEVINFPIAPVENFLKGKSGVERMKTFKVTKEELKEGTKVVVLDYK